MDEYIKREDAISAVCFGCNLEFSDRHCEPSDCEIRHAINAVPATDVVEVVRCKDCKYAKPMSFKGYFMCKRHHKYCRKAVDFCSCGERKSDDGSNSTGH